MQMPAPVPALAGHGTIYDRQAVPITAGCSLNVVAGLATVDSWPGS